MGTGAYTSTVICGVDGFMRRIDLYVTGGELRLCALYSIWNRMDCRMHC